MEKRGMNKMRKKFKEETTYLGANIGPRSISIFDRCSYRRPYTRETDIYKFAYYLTPEKPTDYVPDHIPNPYIIMGNQLTDIRNGLVFDIYFRG